MKRNNNSGFATIIIIFLIFIVGLFVGGVFYLLGSQKAVSQKTSQTNEAMVQKEADSSETVSETVIESELDALQINSIDGDLNDVDRDASQI